MITTSLADQLVRDFWERAGGEEPFPRQLERPIMLTEPVHIVKVHGRRLDAEYIRDHFRRRRVTLTASWGPRALNGCLVAFRGEAAIFVDGTLPPEDVRAVIAHEFGHYLAEYDWPRRRALRHFGPGAAGVLDGLRPPTRGEKFSAALADVPLGVHVHYMNRTKQTRALVAHVEETADIVGAELLAPRRAVLAHFKRTGNGASPKACAELLHNIFGLPPAYAAGYAARLMAAERQGRTFTEILGF